MKASSLPRLIGAALACGAIVAWLASNSGAPPPAHANSNATSATLPLPEPSSPSSSAAPGPRRPSSIVLPGRADVLSTLLNNFNRRNLQAKFAALNQLFAGVTLKLPDAQVSRGGLDITLSNLRCRDLYVGDIRLDHSWESVTSQRLDVDVSGVRIDCSFRWAYKWTIFKGSGDGTARLDPASKASVGLRFLSEDYRTRPPHDVSVPKESCAPDIKIETMDFDGDGLGIIGGVMNVFRGTIGDQVAGELGDVVCEELRGLGDDAFDDLLGMLSAEIDAYLEPLEAGRADPLHMEVTAEIPLIESGDNAGEPRHADFGALQESAGEWIDSARERVDPSWLNGFLRDNFLDSRGKLVLDVSRIFGTGVIFEGHDMLTETTLSVASVEIEGLDSFEEADLLVPIGKRTLWNRVALDRLSIVLGMKAEMKSSSLSDAVVVAPDAAPIVEEFTIDFALSGIAIDASLFLGVNTETFGDMELGSMLTIKNILPCLISALDAAAISGLRVSISDIVPPDLEGFIDQGIDHLLSAGAEALFEMYERAALRALPNFFQTYVRDMANDFIEDALDVYRCPTNDDAELDAYVDFRDLFLPAEEAAAAGGAGDGRHGDVVPWVMGVVEDQLFAADEDGLLAINDALVAPLTESQSGVEGTVKFNGTLFDFEKEATEHTWKAFADSLRVTLSDVAVTGLDTFRSPVKVLAPWPSSPHLLENELNLGVPGRPLGASLRFGMEVGGATSPLASNNFVDVRFGVPSVEVLAVALATVRESRFMRFPLKDVLNFSCWLSMIPASGVDVGLAMRHFGMIMDGLLARTACASCSNGWLEDLNSVVELLNRNGFLGGLKSRGLSIVSDLLQGDWVQGMVDARIAAASRRCPHDAAFDGLLPETSHPPFKATRSVVDVVAYAALPLLQVALVAVAQRHSDLEVPPPVDMVQDAPDDAKLLDLTDLSSIGGWADVALEEARSYLGGEVDGTQDIGIASLLKSTVLEDDGSLNIPLGDMGFEAGGVKVAFYNATVVGLDSFTTFDILKTSGPSTFSNTVKLRRLGATLTMGVSVEDDSGDQAHIYSSEMETITVSIMLKDVDLNVSLLMAMDQDLMGELKLGSILNTKNILFCLLSTIHSVGLSEFILDIGDIEEFSMSGFLLEETSENIQGIVDAIFAEYKSTILDSIPAMTATTLRPILHDILQVMVDEARNGGSCPEPDDTLDGFLDFRDLLLSKERASELLGRGDSPYGNLFSSIYGFAEDLLFSSQEDGLSKLNEMLINPLTKSQSGVEGELRLDGSLVDLNQAEVRLDIWKAFADNLRLTLSDLAITGLDTLHAPIELLRPRSTCAHLLDNRLSLGIQSKPVDASVRFGFEIGDNPSPLATDNVMDLQLSMPSVDVAAAIFPTIRESRFMNFPLKDLLNFSCWLSTIPVSGVDIGLAMHHLNMLFDGGILAKTMCVSCSNSWLEDFNSVIKFLDENEFISGLISRAVSITSGLLKGDWVQGMIDKQIVAASRRCPHDEAFGSFLPDESYPTFKGTRDLVDGILYAAFPLVQVIAIILAQKHSGLEVASPVNVELDTPDDSKLIDLTNLTSVGGWADVAVEEMRNYVGGLTEWNELGITEMLKSTILDDNGLLTIPIKDQGFEAGGVKLSLYNVTMVGLDSFTTFDVLKVSDPNKFSNIVSLETLGVVLKMGLSVDDEASSSLPTDIEMETVTVSLILKDVDLDVSLLMAMDQELVGQLKIGSISNTKNIFSCLLSTIHSMGLSQFVMGIRDIEEFSISGFVSEDANTSIQSITKAIFAEYKPMILGSIPAFTSNTVRPILHGILQVLLDATREDGACPEPDNSLEGILDFRDLFLSQERALELLGRGDSPYGDLIELLYSLLEDMMSKVDKNGLSKMNVLVASLTERQSNETGDIYFPGEIFTRDLDISLNELSAVIELGVSDLTISGIDTLGAPVKVLQPIKGEPSVLNNTAMIGVGAEPFRTEFRLLIKGRGDEIEVHNDLVLGISLQNVDMMLEVLAQIKESPFLHFPLQDLLNLQCWLATAVTPDLDSYGRRDGELDAGVVLKNLALAVTEARLDIECISCSSPLILEMASKLKSQEAVEDTTAVANMLFDYVSNLLGGDFVQSGLDKLLNEAAMQCPHSPAYNQNFPGLKYDELIAPEKSEDSYGFLIAILSVIASGLVIVGVAFFATRFVSRRRHHRWLKTLNRTQVDELQRMQNEEIEREKDLNSRMDALVMSGEVPLFIRLFIPIVIIGNIALFLSGHLSIGGTVNISGSFAGQEFVIDDFFLFSMAKSTIDMWKAGATELAIMIAIFSGVWPYTKLLTTLFIWFAPPRWLSSNRRGKLLRWLDVLGKWSMIDVFVLLVTLASFRIAVQSPDHLNFLPEDLYEINMVVVPLWGLYANMMAQFVAQISSHVIIHYHRKTTAAAARSQEIELGLAPSSHDAPEKLCAHEFKLDYEASSKRAGVRRSVHWILSAVSISFAILVLCGCSLPSFGIEVYGLVGLVIESGNQFEQAQAFYSVFDLATMVMDQAHYLNTASDFVGLGTLSSLLVITVLLVPLAQAASLLTQWFAPMTKKQRIRNTVLNEILDAWQYLEVYVLSIIIAAWQLGGVSGYMINEYCGSLEPTFSSLSYYGILRPDDAQCFRIGATVESASWILVAASGILFVLNNFITGAASQKAQDDDIPAEQRLHTDRWIESKQSSVTVSMDMSTPTAMHADDSDEEDGASGSSHSSEVSVSPIKPRFTDYYFFTTIHHSPEESVQEYEAETAMLQIDEIRSDK